MVVGRSNIVGKPMALLLLSGERYGDGGSQPYQRSERSNQRADILVVAVGKPKMITAEYVRGAVVTIGNSPQRRNKLCGDVDFDSVEPVA